MRFTQTTSRPFLADRRRKHAAFTLAEVLAALAFMLIVIPVVVQGVQLSSRAGTLGVRKAEAARIAERVLNELTVTGEILNGSRNGIVREGGREFQWRMETQPWIEADLDMVSVRVAFDVQGETYAVMLSTLVDPESASTTGTAAESTENAE